MGDVVLELEKHPGEEFALRASFADALLSGEAVVSAVITATDSSGADASATILNGNYSVASPYVFQPIKLGADLEDYVVLIRGVTNATPPAKWDQRFLIRVRIDALTAASLVTTGADANSYATLAEAEAYFSRRLRAEAWDTATRRDKIKALLQAVRELDALTFKEEKDDVDYDGAQPTKPAQALSFPRSYTIDGNGDPYVPQEVKDAQCEQALFLLAAGQGAERRARLQAQGVASFSVEGMSETFRQGAGQPHPWHRLCPEAQRLIARHVEWSVGVTRV